MLRMAGVDASHTVVARPSTAASQSAGEIPITSEIGPQIASPSGWNASEPNQSYALTRESDSSGT